jgi:rhamnose utilization protein RhaD (predicted bifunctional aldolase and dehydrogenase)
MTAFQVFCSLLLPGVFLPDRVVPADSLDRLGKHSMGKRPMLLSNLIHYSRLIGQNISLVQAGGGNTSWKEDARWMWVKASGSCLRDVSGADGFVCVDFSTVRAGMAEVKTESAYTELLMSSLRETTKKGIRPSMETGFHALLGRAVLHTHPIWANLITCSVEGPSLAAKICPEAAWIPYAAPGQPLMCAVQKGLQGKAGIHLVLLQNHGIIISTTSLSKAWALHEKFMTQIQNYFGISSIFDISKNQAETISPHVLFPDQAVYLTMQSLARSAGGQDVLRAHNYIRDTILDIGLTPRYLSSQEVQLLLNMEAEKYRQKVVE